MAGLQAIKRRIDNASSTRKITRAMYMMAASKTKKAKEQLIATRPYFDTVKTTMSEIMYRSKHMRSCYFKEPGANSKKTYLVLTGDKGMAGGYNVNIVNLVSELIKDDPNARLLVAGNMGRGILKRKGFVVDDSFRFQVINPNVPRARDMADIIVNMYKAGETDEVHIVYSEMVSALKQVPTSLRILPLNYDDFVAEEDRKPPEIGPEVLYEPNEERLFDHLVPRYMKGVIYSALIESFSSEQNARMMAMDGATKSADEMIDKLTLMHNRARQAAITQEITEIVGGIPE